MKENNQTDVADTLRTNAADVFDKVIKKDLQQTLIATLQQILDDDTEVGVETQIGFDPQYTKATIIAMTSVDPVEFLANVLFGVCSQQTNIEGKHSIKELNTDYIENQKEKASHISFIRSTAILNNAMPKLSPSFAGDDYQILYETPDGNHVVVLYEHFSHSWNIKNTGLVEWSKRLLVLANKSSTRIKTLDSPIHTLLRIKIALPFSLDKQKQIVQQLNQDLSMINNLISKFQNAIQSLHELRDKLVSDVVTGKIDVRNVEIPDYEYIEEENDMVDDIEDDDELTEEE